MWWNWPTDPEYERRNFLKAVAGLLLIFFSGFPVFLEAGGGVTEQLQEAIHEEMDGSGVVTGIDHGLHWFATVSWPMRIFVAVFVLLVIHFWRGGSLSFRGVGLRGRRNGR